MPNGRHGHVTPSRHAESRGERHDRGRRELAELLAELVVRRLRRTPADPAVDCRSGDRVG